jgi:hypothetical protein
MRRISRRPGHCGAAQPLPVCRIDVVGSASVLVASSVNLDVSSNATPIVFGRLPRPRLVAVCRRPRRRWVSPLRRAGTRR